MFYCSLGHNEHVFWNPKVMQYYLDGIQFALGDLEADTTPSAALSPEYIAESKAKGEAMVIPGLIEEITTFNMGDHADAVTRMEKLVLEAQGNAAKTNALNEALAAAKTSTLINLASKEYFSAVNFDRIPARVITPAFKEERDGKFKFLIFFGKKARGLMAGYIIRRRLKKADDVKKFDVDGYRFNASLSTESEWVFTRK